MELIINGENTALPAGTTVQAMLTARGMDGRGVAVERNGVIVSKSTYAATALMDADRIEIIGFIGGG
jgi:sulfur carrier protein